jgi:threonine dehydrogenase-like Zn-dependent dehydrogenase
MKAAIYYAPGDIRYQEVPDPVCKPEGAIVKVGSCGVCHVMDVDAWIRWQRGGEGPGFARGHEWAGEIVEVGPKVKDFKVGDRIFQNPVFKPCHRCNYCHEGDYWRCLNWREGMAQKAIHGGFAEYVEIPFVTNESAALMPNDLSWSDLAMIEPLYLAIGLSRKASAGETVLVIGQELMGLGTVAKLHERGATVYTADVSDKRLKAAEEVGADMIINSIDEDVVKTVMKATKGRGVDIVILIDTRPAGLMQAMSCVRRAGHIWLAGYYYSPFKVRADVGPSEGAMTTWIGPGAGATDPSVGFDPALLHMQIAWGSLGPRVPRWHEAAEMIKAGTITAAKYVTTEMPLEKTAEAFALTTNDHDQIKVNIIM